MKHSDELWFEDVTEAMCPRSVRSAVARLHVNLAHPPNATLIKFMLAQGAKSSTLAAANALRCASCLRKRQPLHQRPGKLAKSCQFGDRLQSDIFYAIAVDGTGHPFLGIIDLATLLHQVIFLDNRESRYIFDKFADCWFSVFGLPLEIITDADPPHSRPLHSGL